MNIKELNEREREIFKAGYLHGQDDAFTMLGACLRASSDERELDPVAVAEKALRAKGSPMTLYPRAH